MAHTYAYQHIGSINSEQPGVKKQLVRGTITVSTDPADAYVRGTGIVFTFTTIANITDVIGLFSDLQTNTGMVPVYLSISANALSVLVLESGPNIQGPLREKASEDWDYAYNFYATVLGI